MTEFEEQITSMLADWKWPEGASPTMIIRMPYTWRDNAGNLHTTKSPRKLVQVLIRTMNLRERLT